MLSPLSDISLLWISHTSMCPGTITSHHMHDFFQFCYYERGLSMIDQQQVQGGSCLCIHPHQMHGGETFLETTETIDIKFIVHSPTLSMQLRRFNFHELVLDKTSKRMLNDLMDDIVHYQPSQDMLNAALSHFFWRLLNLNPHLLKNSSSTQNNFCDQIVEYLEANYASPITLNDVADHVGLSRNYTSALFSSTLGMTINEYLNLTRIRAASLLISYTDTPIGDIYSQCGFNDWRNFGRTFQKIIGVTPSTYRKAFSASTVNYQDGIEALKDIPMNTSEDASPSFTYAALPQKLIVWDDYYSYVKQEAPGI